MTKRLHRQHHRDHVAIVYSSGSYTREIKNGEISRITFFVLPTQRNPNHGFKRGFFGDKELIEEY